VCLCGFFPTHLLCLLKVCASQRRSLVVGSIYYGSLKAAETNLEKNGEKAGKLKWAKT
jgi:hypothetical protein